MAKLAPYGPFRALDGDGNPLSGGKLFTYEAGTSTPKDTYTDADAGTPNTNPVILDSEGYADVWLGDGAYKFILKDSNDVTLWTIDDITGESSNAFGADVISQSTNLVVTAAYANAFINCTNAITLSLGAAADLGEGFYFTAKASNGAVTVDPDGAETIDGAATKTIGNGYSALIICNGNAWFTAFLGSSTFTGSVVINGSSTEAAYIDLYEDTDNGTNKIKFQAPSSISSDKTITLPDTAGTVALTSQLGGRLLGVQYITATGTYTPTAGANSAYVVALGGGGGGGGVSAVPTIGAAGGGAGERRELYISSGLISQSVTIGAAGTAGANTGTAGGNGGNTSFGSLLTANGGSGGSGNTANNPVAGGAGGSGGSGGQSFPGMSGFWGGRDGSGVGMGGTGGSSIFGRGGAGGLNTDGSAATGYGSGGGGGGGTTAARTGAVGTAGIVVVYEFS